MQYNLVCYSCDEELSVKINEEQVEMIYHCPFCSSDEIELIEEQSDE